MSVIDGSKQNLRALPKDTFEVITTPYELRQRKDFQVDKLYRIRKGNFAGDFWYDPSDSSSTDNLGTVIVAAGGQRLKRIILGEVVKATWFGVVANGTTDDTAALQLACDTVRVNTALPRTLKLPKGKILISDTIQLQTFSAGEYQQFDITLEGNMNMKSGYLGGETSIIGTSALNNKPFIAIQKARAVFIKNINFEGNYTKAATFNITDIVRNARSTWVQSGISNTANSPHCAIAIDPYSPSVPTDGGYPGQTSLYRGTSTGGSSNLQIIGCRFFSFSVGVAMSLSGGLLNAEIIHIKESSFGYCITSLAVGQDQTKENLFEDIQVWYATHTIIDCLNYGAGIGAVPYVNGMNIAAGNYAIYQLVNCESARQDMFFYNVFAESLFKIGTVKPLDFIVNVKASFVNSTFNFLPPDYGVPTADFLINGPADFQGCRLYYLGNANNKWRIKLSNLQSPVVLEGCSGDLPIVSFPRVGVLSHGFNRPVIKNYTMSKYANQLQYNKDYDNLPPGGLFASPVGKFSINWRENSGNTRHYFDYNETAPDEVVSLGSASITVNNNGTASFVATSTMLKYIRVGDYIMSDATMNWPVVQVPDYSITSSHLVDVSPILGIVDSIVGTDVTLKACQVNVPVGVTAAVPLYVNYIRWCSGPVSGTITSGSAVITNVEYHSSDLGAIGPQVGDRLEHPFINKGAYVVSTGVGTITMSDTALATDSHCSIINGQPTITTKANSSPDETKAFYTTASNFFKGARWVNEVQPGGSTERFRFFQIERSTFQGSVAHPLLYKVVTTGIDVVSIANIKQRYAPDPATVFFITDLTKEGFFRYDPADTTTAGDDIDVIVGSFNNNRFKRVQGASTPSLHAVTTVGATTTNAITVSAITLSTVPSTGNKADKIVVRTNGSTALKVIDNVFPDVLQASTTTSDATVTTLASIPASVGFLFEVDATIKANNDTAANFCVYKRQFRFWHNGTSAVLLGSAVTIGTDYEDGGLTGCDVSVDASGTNARIRVTGVGSTFLYWQTKYIIRSLDLPAS